MPKAFTLSKPSTSFIVCLTDAPGRWCSDFQSLHNIVLSRCSSSENLLVKQAQKKRLYMFYSSGCLAQDSELLPPHESLGYMAGGAAVGPSTTISPKVLARLVSSCNQHTPLITQLNQHQALLDYCHHFGIIPTDIDSFKEVILKRQSPEENTLYMLLRNEIENFKGRSLLTKKFGCPGIATKLLVKICTRNRLFGRYLPISIDLTWKHNNILDFMPLLYCRAPSLMDLALDKPLFTEFQIRSYFEGLLNTFLKQYQDCKRLAAGQLPILASKLCSALRLFYNQWMLNTRSEKHVSFVFWLRDLLTTQNTTKLIRAIYWAIRAERQYVAFSDRDQLLLEQCDGIARQNPPRHSVKFQHLCQTTGSLLNMTLEQPYDPNIGSGLLSISAQFIRCLREVLGIISTGNANDFLLFPTVPTLTESIIAFPDFSHYGTMSAPKPVLPCTETMRPPVEIPQPTVTFLSPRAISYSSHSQASSGAGDATTSAFSRYTQSSRLSTRPVTPLTGL